MPKKIIDFGFSFTEKLRQKRETNHTERVKNAQNDEIKRVMELARLDKIVENSSEKNRNFFAAYLGLLIYVQAIVFSTTDSSLLSSVEGLRLPIIDITVPLVGFYAVIPIFIIALHFNFLQNIESHHFKLMQWQEAHPGGKVPRVNLQPFLFDYAILESEGPMWGLVRWANSMLCYNFGPITLGLLLIRYSDCQDYSVTIFHFLAFTFDVWLVWKLRRALKNNEKTLSSSPTVATIRSRFSKKISAGLSGLFCLLVVLVTLGTFFIGGTTDYFFVTYVQPLVKPVTQVDSRLIEWGLPRITIDPTEIIWKPDDKAMHIDADLADKSTDWVKYFKDNGKGFLPTVHSLRFARLPSQNLRKAQLSGIKLQGANLVQAKLQGANLSWAQLQGAHLWLAELQGANLSWARLQGADLWEAELQGANLMGAELQVANLEGAKLQGANLSWARLQGADLWGAELQGAMIFKTGIVGIYSPPSSSVFAVQEVQDMFVETQPDWVKLKAIAGEIQDTETRKSYFDIISEAQKNPSVDAKISWKHNPLAIVGEALPDVCKAGLDSTRAFRSSYRVMADDIIQERKAEYQYVIKDIDNKICKLKECKKLRDSIEGLHCEAK